MIATARHSGSTRTAATWLVAAPLVLAATWFAALPWRAERFIEARVQGSVEAEQTKVPMFMEGPWRVLASELLRTGDARASDATAQTIQQALRLRPLNARTWRALAEMELERGDTGAALRTVDHAATLWPAQADIQWQAANVQIRAGAYTEALRSLRRYWTLMPRATHRVLALAIRLQPEPSRLIPAILPEAPGHDPRSSHYHEQLQSYARRARDARFAEAAWRNAPKSLKQDPAYLHAVIEFLVHSGSATAAIDAWKTGTGVDAAISTIHDPGFESEPAGGGFGWRILDASGATTAIQANSGVGGSRALEVVFDGTENLDFNHVRQYVVIEPGTTYRLTGWWQGERVTTRSGVYVDIRTLDAGRNVYARGKERHGDWPWQAFALDVTVPPDARLAELRIRRNPTEALDHRIAGRVRFDNLALDKVARVEESPRGAGG